MNQPSSVPSPGRNDAPRQRGIRILGHAGPHGGETWAVVDSSGRQAALVFVPPHADPEEVRAALEALLSSLDPAPRLRPLG